MPKTAANVRTCRKCGATISFEGAEGFCGACVLETALEGEDTAPLMDFGEYELLEELGRGGQGVVYRARQKGLNRIVALKIIGLGHWATEAHLKRFRMEAEAAAQLDHPGIVPIYDIGERDGACFFSMKFVEGGQLDELVGQAPPSTRQSAELMAKVARTVHHAHEHGVLHRDIKPGNILIDKQGEPHLTDFGLARLVEKESNVTRTMDVLGTPSYMAPEQARGQKDNLTSATDVYGLGAVFYHLLTGHPPFAGGTTYETIKLVCETEPRSPQLWNRKIDRDLATICLKCLEKDPARRYSSALALAQDLERWLRHEPIRARRAGVMTRSRKWVRRHPVAAAVTPLALASLTLLVLVFSQERGAAPPPASIAVLPFENLSDDKENAFLADGLQDDILTKLAKVADLKVISRTSVMTYRGERNIRKIGNALRVSHVLEGSVHRVDGRIRVNAQLIDARTDTHLWADTYERARAELFEIESEVAGQVAKRLRARVSGAERAELQARPTDDLEAYELYTRAKALSPMATVDNEEALQKLSEAVDLLEKATARDPNFALAYCLLTKLNLDLYWVPGRTDSSRVDRAESALRNAQRLAPEAGETHLAQALFQHYARRDYDGALQELDIAARLLPNSADVFRVSALIERRLGRWRDAVRHFSRAIELDPRDAPLHSQLILTQHLLRCYSEADRAAEEAAASLPEAADEFWKLRSQIAIAQGDLTKARAAAERISPRGNYPSLRFTLHLFAGEYGEAEREAVASWASGRDDFVRFTALQALAAARAQGDSDKLRAYASRARAAYESQLHVDPINPAALSEIGVIDAALGRKEEALAECRRAVELHPISRDAIEGVECMANLAIAYAWLGERDRAFEQLFAIVRLPHGPTYGELKLDPSWNELRDDRRFETILEQARKPLL